MHIDLISIVQLSFMKPFRGRAMKKRYAISILVALSFVLFSFFSAAQDGVPKISKHAKPGIKCESCHGSDTATRVTMPKCLQCHGSYAKVAELTRKDKPNPHESHQGEVRCGECHKEHGQSVNSCNECHTFEMKVP